MMGFCTFDFVESISLIIELNQSSLEVPNIESKILKDFTVLLAKSFWTIRLLHVPLE